MTVFAVDDEPFCLALLRDAIQSCTPDAALRCFSSPSALLEAAKQLPPDVVFLDVEMPGMNGVELAQRLQSLKADLNLIFVTGYSDYIPQALELFVSGYVLKPVDEEAVAEQLRNLRHPVNDEKEISVKTFGTFTVYRHKMPVAFRCTKGKELLAYLIDRNGAVVTRKELDAVLFPDGGNFSRNEQKKLSRYVDELEKDLQSASIASIFCRESNGYRVAVERFDCDLYDFLSGKNKTAYRGAYMEGYEWGEIFKSNMETAGLDETGTK